MSEEERQAWDRQAWESGTAFRYFHDFYLAQDAPRSIDAAYRAYRTQKGHTVDSRQRAPGSWRNWSQGRDANGQPIPGAQSWTERAASWDKHLTDLQNQATEERRRRIFTSGFARKEERVLRLQQLAEFLLGPAGVDSLRELVNAGKGEVWDPDKFWAKDIKAIGSSKHGTFRTVEIVRFNQALVSEARAVLADIAAELGDRKQAVEINDGKPLQVEDVTDVEEVRKKRWEKIAPMLAEIVARMPEQGQEPAVTADDGPTEGADA